MSGSEGFSSIEDIIDDARNGRMFILVDDEDRENEGDLVIPGQMATPDAINFMARFGRGLICLALTRQRVAELRLPPMARRNESRHETAFTVSIEARDGVTTGISASDRARTIAVAIDPTKGADDIVCPGHIFPLEARDGGVLVRAGHTEAAVDVARLAGLNSSGVVCEIMNDDGTMARTPDLLVFARRHGLKVGTIADLIAYRLRHDRVVARVAEAPFDSIHGTGFRIIVFRDRVSSTEHLALIKGDVASGGAVMVRMHALNLLDDVMGDVRYGKARDLRRSIERIDRHGRGAIVVLREAFKSSLAKRVAVSPDDDDGDAVRQLRDYGVGAQILMDLGIREMILLSNVRRTIIGLDGYGLAVSGYAPIDEEEMALEPGVGE